MKLRSEIVVAMQQLAVEQRRLLGVRAPWHVGDIAWGLRQHEGREDEWTFRLWVSGGRTVAWSWLNGDFLDHDVHPDHLHLLDEILDQPGARVAAAFADDAVRREALARHGYVEPGDELHLTARDLSAAPELPELPEGFRYRTVTPDDLAERVAIHRAAFSRPGRPSRVTESSYGQVRAQWPYRESLDCVIEAPDRRFAAFCLCWPDDENKVGELEPVGVHPEFRRRGLGAAVCAYALTRLHEEGGRQAIVYCMTEPACALYASVGFQTHATLVAYKRPGASG